jgi:tetratricopeptide (TPR) repeat protein
MPNGYLMLGASDPVYLNENTTDLIFHRKGTLFSLTQSEFQDKAKETLTRVEPHIYKENKKSYSLEQKHVAKSPAGLITKKDHAFEYENTITKLLNSAEWQQALDLISKYETSVGNTFFILSAKANALANLGKLNEAIDLFKQCIANDPTNRDTYFMYALTLSELNQFAECESALRKTLFLDHEFVPGHFQLGLLLIRNKQQDAGLKSLRNALMIAQTKEPHLAIPGSQGLDYGRLAEILKNEIKLYAHTEN